MSTDTSSSYSLPSHRWSLSVDRSTWDSFIDALLNEWIRELEGEREASSQPEQQPTLPPLPPRRWKIPLVVETLDRWHGRLREAGILTSESEEAREEVLEESSLVEILSTHPDLMSVATVETSAPDEDDEQGTEKRKREEEGIEEEEEGGDTAASKPSVSIGLEGFRRLLYILYGVELPIASLHAECEDRKDDDDDEEDTGVERTDDEEHVEEGEGGANDASNSVLDVSASRDEEDVPEERPVGDEQQASSRKRKAKRKSNLSEVAASLEERPPFNLLPGPPREKTSPKFAMCNSTQELTPEQREYQLRLRKIRQEERMRQKRLRESQEHLNEKTIQECSHILEKFREEQEQARQREQDIREERMRQLRLRHEEREKERIEMLKIAQEAVRKKPLFQKIEDRYRESLAREQRVIDEQLNKIHEKYHPKVGLSDEIRFHEERYQQLLHHSPHSSVSPVHSPGQNPCEVSVIQPNRSYFVGKTKELFLEEERLRLESMEKEHDILLQKRIRQLEYARMIQQEHKSPSNSYQTAPFQKNPRSMSSNSGIGLIPSPEKKPPVPRVARNSKKLSPIQNPPPQYRPDEIKRVGDEYLKQSKQRVKKPSPFDIQMELEKQSKLEKLRRDAGQSIRTASLYEGAVMRNDLSSIDRSTDLDQKMIDAIRTKLELLKTVE